MLRLVLRLIKKSYSLSFVRPTKSQPGSAAEMASYKEWNIKLYGRFSGGLISRCWWKKNKKFAYDMITTENSHLRLSLENAIKHFIVEWRVRKKDEN